MTAVQRGKFIKDTRMLVDRVLADLDALDAKMKEYTAMDVGSVLEASDLPDWDITVAQFIAIFTTIGALQTFLAAGHYTNLYNGRFAIS